MEMLELIVSQDSAPGHGVPASVHSAQGPGYALRSEVRLVRSQPLAPGYCLANPRPQARLRLHEEWSPPEVSNLRISTKRPSKIVRRSTIWSSASRFASRAIACPEPLLQQSQRFLRIFLQNPQNFGRGFTGGEE